MSAMSDESVAEKENWFLGKMEEVPLPFDEMLSCLEELAASARTHTADSWGEMLQDALAEQGCLAEGVTLLGRRAAWVALTGREDWKARAQKAMSPDPDGRAYVDESGFADTSVALRDCVARLETLVALQPKTLCYDKTWGVGVVLGKDPFYKSIEIDFEKKRGHRMSFAYAAATLRLLPPEHLLSIRHREPERLRTMLAEAQGDVVRLALRGMGEMTVAQLQDFLVPSILPEGDWKKFWEAARRDLKKDPLCDIPAKRSEPIRLLDRALAYDAHWAADLSAERDMKTLLDRIEACLDAGAFEALGANEKDAVGERLAFVVKGAAPHLAELWVRAVLLADRSAAGAAHVDVAAQAERFAEPKTFLHLIHGVPARYVRALFDFLDARGSEAFERMLLDRLDVFHIGVFSEAIAFLIEKGYENECAALFRERIGALKPTVEMMCWIARNPDRIGAWSLGDLPAIAQLMLDHIEESYSGEKLKACNALRDRFEQKAWLRSILDAMTPLQRAELVGRIGASPGWSSIDRKSVLASIVKLRPELEAVTAGRADAIRGATSGPMTSERSFRERQKQLEQIANVELVKIAREIGVARSYGDLRENFEYKAAKDMQALLMRRKAELEQMLQSVRPTDFSQCPAERAGMGTTVTIAHADGREERFVILGEWDQDDALGIVSCNSRLALALEGHGAGETVLAPTAEGEQDVTVLRVEGLSPEVQEWIQAEPSAEKASP